MKTIYKSILSFSTLLAMTLSAEAKITFYTASSAYTKYGSCKEVSGYGIRNLYDGNPDTEWHMLNAYYSMNLGFKTADSVKVNGYMVQNGSDGNCPSEWELSMWVKEDVSRYGSSNTYLSDWSVFASVSNTSQCMDRTPNKKFLFLLDNEVTNQRFQLSLKGGTYLDLSDFLLFYCDHQTTLIHHEAVSANCTYKGTIEYWECPDCHQTFSDATGQTVEKEISIDIVASHHAHVTHHAYKPALCITDGSLEHWSCDDCGKLFSDSDCTSEVDAQSLVVDMLRSPYLKAGEGQGNDSYCGYFSGIPYAGSQMLYSAEDLQKSTILGYALYCSKIYSVDERNILVYMAETDLEYLDTESPIDVSDMTLVYQGRLISGAKEGWEEVILDTPFQYSGVKNLAVAIYSSNDGYCESNSYRVEYNDSYAIGRYGYSEVSNADPENKGEYYNTNRPIIRFKTTLGGHANDLAASSSDGMSECTFCHESYEADTLGSVSFTDGVNYLRKSSAVVTGSMSYTRNFESAGQWESLCLPFTFQYTAEDAARYELAEIHTYGIIEDTNGDGILSGRDQKQIVLTKVAVNTLTASNQPYLVRVKRAGTVTFTAYGKCLDKAAAVTLDCGTLREHFAFTGNYAAADHLDSIGAYMVGNNALNKVTDADETLLAFRWYSTTNSRATSIPFYIDPTEFELIDSEAYSATMMVRYPQFTYSRTFASTQWQAFYVPFAISVKTLEEYGLKVAELNDTHMYDRDDDGEPEEMELEFFTLKSGVTEANYPYLIKPTVKGEVTIDMENVRLEKSVSTSIECSTFSQVFTIIGSYNGVSGSEMYANQYYALSGTGLSKVASVSESLAPQRWYLSVTNKSDGTISFDAPQIRVRIDGEWEEETGICTVGSDQSERVSYRLDGRKVSEAKSGLYLQDGKKIFVK